MSVCCTPPSLFSHCGDTACRLAARPRPPSASQPHLSSPALLHHIAALHQMGLSCRPFFSTVVHAASPPAWPPATAKCAPSVKRNASPALLLINNAPPNQSHQFVEGFFPLSSPYPLCFPSALIFLLLSIRCSLSSPKGQAHEADS